MNAESGPYVIMADDDADDRELAEHALRGTSLEGKLQFARDGVELLAFLCRLRDEPEAGNDAWPVFILLDLNMPKMNGHEVLTELKGDPVLRRIPVVVLTTSSADDDIVRSYDLGVNAFVTKPVRFDELREVLARVGQFWLEVASVPQH